MPETIANRRFAELQKVFAGGRANHAYLFLGAINQEHKDGIRRLAQTLLCLSAAEKPCGHCPACRSLQLGNHPDFRVIAPEGGKIKLEEIRELCYDAVLNPYLSPCKVYFFEQFETLTEVAANAFLKTLEEPPPAVYFLALAEHELGILPTIRSRMQRILLGGGRAEAGTLTDAALPVTDLYALFRQAEKIGAQDRAEVELFLERLQNKLRTELLAEVKTGTVRPGLVRANAAVQQARAYAAANLNLRLLLEDLFLTLYEELGKARV